MTRTSWCAYYFDTLDNTLPPARMEIIEAENEDDAGRIATAQMGRSMRVDVTRPVWGPPRAVGAVLRPALAPTL
jgi:stage III sporulation protein SpoIIIAA